MYITALEGLVPVDITKTFNAFLDFCYIAWKSILTEDDLDSLDAALKRFHHYCVVFQDVDVQPEGFSLPHQHALVHYHCHIQNFGAPNGLCLSITESKHIKAVKRPWHRSNRYNALQQMIRVDTRNDKLAAARADFLSRGMLGGTCLGDILCTLSVNQDDTDEDTTSDSDGEDLDLDSDRDESDHGKDSSCGPVDGPPILGEVTLGLKKGMFMHNSPQV